MTALTVLVHAAAACGGGAATAPRDEPGPEPRASEAEPAPAVEEVAVEAVEPAAPESTPAPAAPPEPVLAATADEIRAALAAAASDAAAFRRLVDPEHGVGVIDPGDAGVVHYCEVDRLAALPGLGFVLSPEDGFSCDRGLERCVATASDGRGTVFHLRRRGDVVTLDTIAHHARRPPATDDARTRTFVAGGDGVCALHRALLDERSAPPVALSVFVSAQTGLVPDALSAQLCHREAAAAFDERLRPVLGTPPTRCERAPARCTYLTGDEEAVVYGGARGVTAVTVTRPGMRPELERAQRRDLDSFLRAMARHLCPAEPADEGA